MADKLGMDAKLYFGDAAMDGTNKATIGWTVIDNVKDVTVNLQKGEADTSTRGNNGFRKKLGTLKDGSIEFEMVWNPGDAAFTAIKDAFFNNTEISIAAMDGAIATAGNQGLASNFSVLDFTRNEPLEEAITVNVKLSPSSFSEWYLVA